MNNFDLKKYLTENRLTSVTRVSENERKLNFAERIAHLTFDRDPSIEASVKGENMVLKLAYEIALDDLINGKGMDRMSAKKTLRYQFGYNEDFPSDLVSAYFDLQKQGTPAPTNPRPTPVTENLQVGDEVEIIKNPEGSRDKFYQIRVKPLAGKTGKITAVVGNGFQVQVGGKNFVLAADLLKKSQPMNEGPELTLLSRAQELVGNELSPYILPETLEYDDFEEVSILDFTLQLPPNFDQMDAENIAQDLSDLSYNSGPGGHFLTVQATVRPAEDEYINIDVYARGGLDI